MVYKILVVFFDKFKPFIINILTKKYSGLNYIIYGKMFVKKYDELMELDFTQYDDAYFIDKPV